MKKISLTTLVSIFLVIVTGCTSLQNTDVTKDMIPASVANNMIEAALKEQREELGKRKETEIAITMMADNDVNRRANAIRRTWEESHSGTPISIKILQLSDDSMLLSADQESLNNDINSALGKTYLDHNDFVLTPGQFKFIDFETVNEKTKYIAVVAGYNDINRSTWKQVIKLDSKSRKQPLFVHLKMQEVVLKTEN